MLASAVNPATRHVAWSSIVYVFSLVFDGASSLDTTRRSAASTTPSVDFNPTHVPALLMASIAYSTWLQTTQHGALEGRREDRGRAKGRGGRAMGRGDVPDAAALPGKTSWSIGRSAATSFKCGVFRARSSFL
jgi:hypothetical protein